MQMARQVTSIFIGDSIISVLEASGKQPQNWATLPLAPGLVKDGTVLDINAVAARVREVCQSAHIGGGKVVAGISGINCLYRIITLPSLPGNMLPEAVQREAARVLGVPMEQFYLSWQTLPSTSRSEIRVYLVATPKRTVDTLISTLRKAGLNPYLMDLKPLALARTTTESEAILLDVQPTSFDIIIMTEMTPQVVRSLPVAADTGQEERLSIIRDELERAITFYNSSHKDSPLEQTAPLLVSGEIAGQEDTWELLAGEQGRPVRLLPCPLKAPDEFPCSRYVTNAGLTFKETAEKAATAFSLVNLNIFPEIYRPKPRPVHEVLFMPVLIGGIALVALGAFTLANTIADKGTPFSAYPSVLGAFTISGTSPYVDQLQLQLDNITQTILLKTTAAQTEIADYEAEIKTLTAQYSSQVQAQEDVVAAFNSVLDHLGPSKDEINGDLGEMNRLPGAIDLMDVNHDNEIMTVKGTADDENVIFSYAGNLRASGRFALVVISEVSYDENSSRTQFTLTLTKAEKDTE
jgi:type IV pilus assembly protein PilM